MSNQNRYKLTPEDIAILTRPGGWRDQLDRMVISEEDRLKYQSNKVKKKETKKNG